MNALQKRVSKMEGPIGANAQMNFLIHLTEPGTMRVTSRLRSILGGGFVKVDEDGKEIDARITTLETKQ